MRDILEQLLRAADVPDLERAELYWAEYRSGGPGANVAFATLLAWYGTGLRRCIWRSAPPAEVDDVFQDVLARLHAHRHHLATFEHALRWLYTVAVNRCIDVRRRAERRRRCVSNALPRPGATTQPGADRELHESLRVALAKLPKKLNDVVRLVFFADLDHQSVAKVLGINRDTVAARKAAALKRLRELVPIPAVLGAGGALGVEVALAARPDPLSAVRLAELAGAAWKKASPTWTVWTKAALVAGAVVLTGGFAVGGWTLTREPRPEPVPNAPAEFGADPAPPRPVQETLQDKHRRVFEAQVRPKIERAIQRMDIGAGGRAEIVRFDAYDTRLELLVCVQPGTGASVPGFLKLRFDARGGDHRVYVSLLGSGRWKQINPAKPVYTTVPGIGDLVFRFAVIDDVLKAFREVDWADTRLDPEHAARIETFRRAAAPFLGEWYEDGDPAKRFTVEFDPKSEFHRLLLRNTFHSGARTGHEAVDLRVTPDGRLEAFGLGSLTPDGRRWIDFPEVGRFSTRRATKP